MRTRGLLMVFGLIALAGMALAPAAFAADPLIVVSTPASLAKAADWTKFLASKNIPVKNVAPGDVAGFKDAKHVVLLGALDEAGGIKALTEKALSKSEMERMNQAGSSAMYVKSDVWSKGQEVIVFTGAGDKGVETARKGNRAEWMDIILGWYGLESEVGKSGTPSY